MNFTTPFSFGLVNNITFSLCLLFVASFYDLIAKLEVKAIACKALESSNWKKNVFVLFLCFDLGASREWVMMFLWCSLKAPARACGIEFSRSWGTQREAAAEEEEWEKMSDSRSTVKPANNTKNGKISNEVLLCEMAHENSFHFLSIDWLLEQKKEIRRRVMRRVEG